MKQTTGGALALFSFLSQCVGLPVPPQPGNKALLCLGGGAAGIFGAIQAAERAERGSLSVFVLEQLDKPLTKVKISGGGRCNVLHDARKSPQEISQGYPRGSRELMGPLSGTFGPAETKEWFNARGVQLKTEKDGRMFPVTDSSQTVIDCLMTEAEKVGVQVLYGCKVKSLKRHDETGFFLVDVEVSSPHSKDIPKSLQWGEDSQILRADRILVATGSNRAAHAWAEAMGHKIDPVIPSLFTFKSKDERLQGLAGVSCQDVELTLVLPDGERSSGLGAPKKKKKRQSLTQRGPFLVTHEGLSGPAVLKLSAFGAKELHDCGYKGVKIRINFAPHVSGDVHQHVLDRFKRAKTDFPRKDVASFCPVTEIQLPRRLWKSMVQSVVAEESNLRWADCPGSVLGRLADQITKCEIEVLGRGLFKEEFVTCGGVSLASLNMKTMESRLHPGLHFAGEVIAVDGITGGYNLQSAWTTGYLAGKAIAESLDN